MKDAKFKLVERETFAIELPDWKVEVEEGGVGIGKYKVGRKGEFSAEVAWQGGQALNLVELAELAEIVASGFEFEIDERSSEDLPDQLRVHLKASLKGKVWMAMTLITCKKTGVMITLGFVARDRADSMYMFNRAIKTFECRGDAPVVGIQMPAVELDESFGQHIESDTLILANKAGEFVITIGGTSDTVRGARKYPDKILRVFSQILELSLEKDGETTSQQGIAGVEQWIAPAKEVRPEGSIPAILGGFACPSIGQGFLFIAQSDSNATIETLSKLVSKLGCPDNKIAPVEERQSACAVGVQEFCKPDGE
ncbi:MAG: hypothetical protein JKY56_24690 [Kofleriaceae bacterium]|nr:hypothetical protein [Kofleriaceae bacterium]